MAAFREAFDRPESVAMDLRHRIAVHESGHALVGLSYGLQIRGMHINPNDKSSGTKFLRDDFDRLMLDDQVVVALAGAEAVQIVGCEQVTEQALEDSELVRTTLLRHGIDENTAEGSARGKSIRKNARVWAHVILDPRRESLIKLATVLSEAGELNKEQIAALLAS